MLQSYNQDQVTTGGEVDKLKKEIAERDARLKAQEGMLKNYNDLHLKQGNEMVEIKRQILNVQESERQAKLQA